MSRPGPAPGQVRLTSRPAWRVPLDDADRAAARQARTPPPVPPAGPVRLTGRGAAAVLFAACFLGLLVAAWTGWSALGDAIFVIACGVVTCFTRASGLRQVVVCPPLAFFTGAVLAAVITAPGAFSVAEQILVTLGGSAPWLFVGTALTVAIAFGRCYRPQHPAMALISKLGGAARGAWAARVAPRGPRPRGPRGTRPYRPGAPRPDRPGGTRGTRPDRPRGTRPRGRP